MGRFIHSQRRQRNRDETKDLIRDLQSLTAGVSEGNKQLSPMGDGGEAIVLRSATLERIDNLLRKGETREDFVNTAVEDEFRRRQSEVATEKKLRKE